METEFFFKIVIAMGAAGCRVLENLTLGLPEDSSGMLNEYK